jgi:hypothetical protein
MMTGSFQELVQEIEARERIGGSNSSYHTQLQHYYLVTCCSGAASVTSNTQQKNCRAMKSVDNHKRALVKSGCCFVCLRRGHISQECRAKTHCFECGGKHHASICNQVTGESEAAPPVVSSCDRASQSGLSLNPKAGSFQPTTSASLLVGAKGTAARVRI